MQSSNVHYSAEEMNIREASSCTVLYRIGQKYKKNSKQTKIRTSMLANLLFLNHFLRSLTSARPFLLLKMISLKET